MRANTPHQRVPGTYRQQLGDIVSFDPKGQVITGRVDKINKKSIGVSRWRVYRDYVLILKEIDS